MKHTAGNLEDYQMPLDSTCHWYHTSPKAVSQLTWGFDCVLSKTADHKEQQESFGKPAEHFSGTILETKAADSDAMLHIIKIFNVSVKKKKEKKL